MDIVLMFQQAWNGVTIGAGYAIFALGLALVFGVMGVVNIAHGEFCMLGAMLIYSLAALLGMNYFLAFVIAIIALAGFGIIFMRLVVQPLLRVSPLSTLLSTLAAGFVILHFSIAIWGTSPRIWQSAFTWIWDVGGVRLTGNSIALLAFGAMASAALLLFLSKARLGKEIRATAQNRAGATLQGINVNWIYTLALMLSAAAGAVAGGLLAPIKGAYPLMGQDLLLKGFATVITAGMGNLVGCIVVGLGFGITEALFGQYVTMVYRDVWVYGVMIIVLLLRPQGLFAKGGKRGTV